MAYHISSEWPIESAELKRLVGLGKHGVLLFFIISGWLIGGIFFREHSTARKVNIPKFWYRRWTRTLPPYFIALGINYAAVRFDRNQAFDLSYLLFLQNYREALPFFGVSWSLCVEEHFYLLLPLVLTVLFLLGFRWVLPALIAAAILPSILRFLDPFASPFGGFGYSLTATHLVCEGLSLGVAASFTFIYHKETWSKIQAICRLIWPLGIAVFVSTAYWNKEIHFYFAPFCITFAFLVFLCAFAERKSILAVRIPAIFWIAQISYSVYLTHYLAIHLGRRLVNVGDLSQMHNFFALMTWVFLIVIGGMGFWFFIERPSMKVRDAFQNRLFLRDMQHTGR